MTIQSTAIIKRRCNKDYEQEIEHDLKLFCVTYQHFSAGSMLKFILVLLNGDAALKA